MAKESVLANHETIKKALMNDHGLKATAAARLIGKYRDAVNSGIELMSGAWFVANQLLEKEYGENEPPTNEDMDPNWKGPVDEEEEDEGWDDDDELGIDGDSDLEWDDSDDNWEEVDEDSDDMDLEDDDDADED